MKLKLAAELSLPVEVVTQTMAILAKRRAGKSYTMRRLAEQLFKAGQQVVIVDPKGDQWGLRSSADGKGPGLPIVILGGERGDAPLEVGAGDVVAKLVVEERVSVLIDLSLFRKREVAVFMTAFLETLYRLKAREVYRTPVMLVIDEADAIAPQKPQDGEERMLGAAEDIVRRGGQRGIGCVLVTQRSAVLNKNVLTQAEVLVALRTIAPQDLAAMNAWIDVHGTPEQRKQLMESLPSLPIGDAWFWSPGWPTADGIFKRVHVLPIETFDSGASPAPGVKRVEPKNLADVDLDKLKGQMAATIEKAKADDPKELKRQLGQASGQLAASAKRISELEARVSATSAFSTSNEGKKTEVKPTPVLTDADRALAAKLLEQINGLKDRLLQKPDTEPFDTAVFKILTRKIDELEAKHGAIREQFLERLQAAPVQKLLAKLEQISAPPSHAPTSPLYSKTPRNYARESISGALRPSDIPQPDGNITRSVNPRRAESKVQSPMAEGTGQRAEGTPLAPGERKILTAVAQFGEVDRVQLTVLVGYKATARDTYIARLAQKGLVESGQGRVRVTDAGVGALGPDYEPLPSGDALLQFWRGRLAPGECKVLDVVVRAYPNGITRADLGEATQYKPTARDTYISRLASRRLLKSDGRGAVKASPELFS